MDFQPIAIVGRACVLPGANDVEQLSENLRAGRDLVLDAPAGRWRLDDSYALGEDGRDRAWSARGGYVEGFESTFDPTGFGLDAELVSALDPLFQWSLHTARTALGDAGIEPSERVGVVLGNLSFPSEAMTELGERIWLERNARALGVDPGRLDVDRPHSLNRYGSGLPAHFVSKALGLGRAYALDAACATSLYALQLAADQLHRGEADAVLAGAVNRADSLFLHVGFCALKAMSRTGQSRPFHREADGLVPAEGAAFVALKRLGDALRDDDEILGVIRGVGLSNDGRGRGFLAPLRDGQVRALRDAYRGTDVSPSDVGYVECHATGTSLGDATELESMQELWPEGTLVGSHKSNFGHAITVAGLAGLLKVLDAFEHRAIAPTLHADDRIELADQPFEVVTSRRDWDGKFAAINAFGFGGNNAHVVVERWEPKPEPVATAPLEAPEEPIAIVASWHRVGDVEGDAVLDAYLSGEAVDATATQIELDLDGLRFPPRDLEHTLGQQLAILAGAREITDSDVLAGAAPDRTSVFVGMGVDTDIVRYGARWRMAQWGSMLGRSDDWVEAARDAFTDTLVAEGVVGSMPNIPANRINSQLDLGGPSFTVSSEEVSGLRALRIARQWLEDQRIDAAIVGAVELGDEAVNATIEAEVHGSDRRMADAACVLVLRRLADAESEGLDVLAVLDDSTEEESWTLDSARAREIFGHAHAADSLVDVALAAQCCGYGVRPGPNGAGPWIEDDGARRTTVAADALGEQSDGVTLASRGSARPLPLTERPTVVFAHGETRDEVIAALREHDFVEAPEKHARVALVGTPSSLSDRVAEAVRILEAGRTFADGIYYREGTLDGEVAFVFTGSASPYPGMAADLVTRAPQLFDMLAERVGTDLRTASQAEWVYEWGDAELATDPERQVWSASWVSQLHAGLSRDVLKLSPDAAIGYSLGESNALFALRAWDDLGQMLHDLPDSKLFRRELAGDHAAVRATWSAEGHIDAATSDGEIWQSWTVLGPVDKVREVIDEVDLCHVTIVNTDDECIIGGAPDACDAALLELLEDPKIHASRLPYRVAIHAPEVERVADAYRDLHDRPTEPVEGVRFYSNASGTTYEISRDACADALVGQATGTVEFPRTIRNAWDDGVRIFVEHGPRALCTGWVRRILGDREHLALSLDRQGVPAANHILNVAARLILAGVDVDWRAFTKLLSERTSVEPKHPFSLPAHRPPVELGLGPDVAVMPSAPAVPFADAEEVDVVEVGEIPAAPTRPMRQSVGSPEPHRTPPPAAPAPRPNGARHASMPYAPYGQDPISEALRFQQQVANLHTNFMHRQAQAHEHFLALQQTGVRRLAAACSQGPQPTAHSRQPTANSAQQTALTRQQEAKSENREARSEKQEAESEKRGARSQKQEARSEKQEAKSEKREARSQKREARSEKREARSEKRDAPALSREDLEYLSHGEVSKLFGPEFAPQDDYPIQVRMPMPPLLLADRVTEIDAEPASMKPGRIVTQTDVTDESWYLHHGRMPAGIMIESGQADLLLVSYLGVDLLNKGERMYRLLGCDLTYRGPLPKPGETLEYDIEIDGFAKHGDVRLFFFHYDCRVDGELRLQVRSGQAGFFTEGELEQSGGILWTAETGEHDPDAPVAEPVVECTKSSLTSEELHAFADGRPWECFGEGWEFTKTHLRSPSIEPGRWVFLDRVTDLDYRGGPWGKGYLRAEADVSPDDWFFEGHFHNDPCMPGTLMFEAALQAMAVYFAANGFTIDRDGWRFQPVQDSTYDMRCRGQCDPGSKRLVYEIFVEELDDGSEDGQPKLFADMLVTVDGLKAFWCRRMGLELVPDYPQAPVDEPLLPGNVPLANEDQVRAIQLGRPSDAFGEMYEPFDGPRAVPRLPGPPYDLVTRVREATGHLAMEPGAEIVAEYDVPADAWYFDEGGGEMPYGVLLEAGLQPCGWLASWVGCAVTSKTDVYFRNLDGTGTLHRAVTPDDTMLTTRATLTKLSRSGPMTIVGFDVVTESAGEKIYEMETVFGFFPEEALASQAGITDDAPPEVPGVTGSEELDEQGLLGLLTRAVVDPTGGIHGAGRVTAQMDVDPGHWFFKAHFFTDPVQPGSLGLQLLLDALSMLDDRAPAASIGSSEHTWKYRGQVRPWNEVVTADVHRREDGLADAWLWVDGECIYRFENFGL